ncbi:MAG: hypothetical protein H7X94_12220 [Vallitaleaceae bacterium]|nr:hypothetical protein [Vallitaleaceae bacterium]
MAGFFNKVSKGLNKGASTISIKSSTMMETNKIKGEISSLKKEKTEVFTAVGDKLYNMKREENVNFEELEVVVARAFEIDGIILEKEAAIAEVLRKQEEALRALGEETSTPAPAPEENRICSCGAEVGPNTKFCSKCGKKMEDEIVIEEPVEELMEEDFEEVVVEVVEPKVIICECGAQLPADTVFCSECGAKVQ